MTTAIPTDVEALVVGWLDAQGVAGGRVYGEHPASATYPYVLVTRVGGTKADRRRPLDRAVVQIDVWAETKADAHDVAATAWARLQDMSGTVAYGGVSGVVAGVRDVVGLTSIREPDSDLRRYMFQAAVLAHP